MKYALQKDNYTTCRRPKHLHKGWPVKQLRHIMYDIMKQEHLHSSHDFQKCLVKVCQQFDNNYESPVFPQLDFEENDGALVSLSQTFGSWLVSLPNYLWLICFAAEKIYLNLGLRMRKHRKQFGMSQHLCSTEYLTLGPTKQHKF